MKKIAIVAVLLLIASWSISQLHADEQDMSTIFPPLDGWTAKGKPDIYNPDNLFEYINGAADVFLAYDFQELATITYENDKKHSFTVDVYRHSNDKNGFGIYSAEKPQKGDYNAIGTQGYYEKGVLNFLKGSYYVKLSGFDLGDNDKKVLTAYAKAIVKGLDGVVTFPAALACFPEEGKMTGSDRYIARDFMGHSFLHSAFVADYEISGKKYEVFIMETDTAETATEIIQKYLAFLKKKGKTVTEKDGYYRFQDPYYRSSGTMNLKKSKNYLWGLFSKDDIVAESIIKKVQKNLEAKK